MSSKGSSVRFKVVSCHCHYIHYDSNRHLREHVVLIVRNWWFVPFFSFSSLVPICSGWPSSLSREHWLWCLGNSFSCSSLIFLAWVWKLFTWSSLQVNSSRVCATKAILSLGWASGNISQISWICYTGMLRSAEKIECFLDTRRQENVQSGRLKNTSIYLHKLTYSCRLTSPTPSHSLFVPSCQIFQR